MRQSKDDQSGKRLARHRGSCVVVARLGQTGAAAVQLLLLYKYGNCCRVVHDIHWSSHIATQRSLTIQPSSNDDISDVSCRHTRFHLLRA